MGKDISIEDDHDRKLHRFCDSVCLKEGIKNLLVIFAIKLNPSRITLREGVTLIGPYVPWRRDSPINIDHHDREPCSRGPVKHLVHVSQSMRGSSSEDPNPSCGSSDEGSHGSGF